EKGVILGALKTTALEDSTRRVLLAGARYEYPVPQDKLSPFDGAGMRSRLETYLSTRMEEVDLESLSLFLFENVSGLALPTAREIILRAVKRAGSVKNTLSSAYGAPLWEFVGEFCLHEPCAPCLKLQNGQAVDFFAFHVDGGEEMPSLCKAEDEFFTRRESKKGFEDKKRKLENTARGLKKKLTKKLQDTLERLSEAEKAEDYRVKGELLTANLYRIEKGMSGVELENWYDENGGTVKITLDATLSPAKNAQRYFKIYNKHKRTAEVLTPMLKSERAEIEYVDSVLVSIANAENALDLKEIEVELTELGLLRAPKERVGGKKKEVPLPYREFEFVGFKIYAGRNNIQNDRLLRDASPDDIWLHTQKYHSSHVIIAVRGGQVRDEIILRAAEICAYYSDGRDGDKIPVDYCKRKFVKKPNKSKAGFVIYTDYKTVLVKPKLEV
ncbi:MAG: NFACT family protein, partial [Clostridia bacterium]|nr:NFACT family protein [Clostridia bacterium]